MRAETVLARNIELRVAVRYATEIRELKETIARLERELAETRLSLIEARGGTNGHQQPHAAQCECEWCRFSAEARELCERPAGDGEAA